MKVIIVSTVGLIYDGITSVILSYLEEMDLTGMEVYVAGTIEVKPNIRERIEVLGCHIVDLPSRKVNPFFYALELEKFIRKNHIQVIHAHGNSGTLAIEMVAAWLGGCNKRISHSHNTCCDQVKADRLLRPVFNLFYTDALSCGTAAGKWLFDKKPFTILTNGRNVNVFTYNSVIRRAVRNEYGINDELVIGHVGGFFEQKNHKFLLEIYRAILELKPTAKLFMIGDGPLKKEIESKANDIKNSVIFTGTTDRISDYLQAMDGMLLPSHFEGLPLVAVEWQLNGLPCVFADSVTNECVLTDTVEFMSLNDSADQWATKIIDMVKQSDRAKNAAIAMPKVREAGFDIKDSAAVLKKIYLTKG
ncbi:glycosyltransferase family 1 protein [Lacrimispora sp.]|uniref:glycosyltransferase family 1 protein n=1 Tax=Lacrimispora sp. TaxID=2719234 RepID=UPI0028AF9A97|nr:glycosyltransferase family 1 protein [Lacrimispora sp.]